MYFKEIKDAVSIPVIAIGGINLLNAKEVIQAGADGICAISAVITKPNVRKEILSISTDSIIFQGQISMIAFALG